MDRFSSILPKLRRSLFNLATAVSLALFLAGITAAALSFRAKITNPFIRGGRQWEATIDRGQLILTDRPQLSAESSRFSAALRTLRDSEKAYVDQMISTDKEIDKNAIERASNSGDLRAKMRAADQELKDLYPRIQNPPQTIGLPFRLSIALSGILPAWWLWRRMRRRVRPGCCTHCGYDLRATPNRCPECGAAASS